VATACWGLDSDYAVASTRLVIAGHGAVLTHSSGVVARGYNALVWYARQRPRQGWYLSQELCSSVKHSPKHMQRPRQHADAGFRGGALSGESILGGWSPAGKAKDRRVSSRPSCRAVVGGLLLCFLFQDQLIFGRRMLRLISRKKAKEQSKLWPESRHPSCHPSHTAAFAPHARYTDYCTVRAIILYPVQLVPTARTTALLHCTACRELVEKTWLFYMQSLPNNSILYSDDRMLGWTTRPACREHWRNADLSSGSSIRHKARRPLCPEVVYDHDFIHRVCGLGLRCRHCKTPPVPSETTYVLVSPLPLPSGNLNAACQPCHRRQYDCCLGVRR
jgi:hypothetical protein